MKIGRDTEQHQAKEAEGHVSNNVSCPAGFHKSLYRSKFKSRMAFSSNTPLILSKLCAYVSGLPSKVPLFQLQLQGPSSSSSESRGTSPLGQNHATCLAMVIGVRRILYLGLLVHCHA